MWTISARRMTSRLNWAVVACNHRNDRPTILTVTRCSPSTPALPGSHSALGSTSARETRGGHANRSASGQRPWRSAPRISVWQDLAGSRWTAAMLTGWGPGRDGRRSRCTCGNPLQAWGDDGSRLCEELDGRLGRWVEAAVEHVGSTAVPGLAASRSSTCRPRCSTSAAPPMWHRPSLPMGGTSLLPSSMPDRGAGSWSR